MQTYADRLFYLLATIDVLWTSIALALQGLDIQAWIAAFLRKVMTIGIFLAILKYAPTWMQSIIDSFQKIGQDAAAISPITPSGILADGLQISGTLLWNAAKKGVFLDEVTSLGYMIAGLVIVAAYVIICIHFVKALIDTYLSVRAAYIFLGFGGSRWTSPYTERYITLVIAAGVRLMVLYLFIGLGHTFATTWWITGASNAPWSPSGILNSWAIAAGAIIFASVCWSSPKFIAGLMSGTPSLSGHDLVGFTAPIAQASLATGTIAATAATAGLAAPVAAGAGAASVGAASSSGAAAAGTTAQGAGAAAGASRAASTGAGMNRLSTSGPFPGGMPRMTQPAAPTPPPSPYQPAAPTPKDIAHFGHQMAGHAGALPRDGGGAAGPTLPIGHSDE